MKVLLLRSADRVEDWLLAMTADAYSVPFAGGKTVGSGVVLRHRQIRGPCCEWHKSYSDAIVPNCNIILAPLEAGVQFVCRRHYFVEVPNDVITLDLGYTHNLCNETWIEKRDFHPVTG